MSDAVDLTPSESEMLDLLRRALTPPPVAPTDESRRILGQAVASLVPPRPSRRARVASRRRQPWVVVGAFFGIAVIGTGSAFAAGVPIPAPLREAASALHLPVTPQSMVDVHEAASALRQSLIATASDPEATVRAARNLTTQYHGLDPTQQAQVRATTRSLLDEACARLGPTIGSDDTPGSDHALPAGLAPLWPGCHGGHGGAGSSSVTPDSDTGTPASTVHGPGPTTHGTLPSPGTGQGSGTPGWHSTTGASHGGSPVTGAPHGAGGGAGSGGGDGGGGAGGGGADGGGGVGSPGRTGGTGHAPHSSNTNTGPRGEHPDTDGPLRRGEAPVHR